MFDGLIVDPVIHNIAIATDFSPWSERAMHHAIALARKLGAILHIVHVVRRTEFPFVPDLMIGLDQLAERDCDDLIRRLTAAHNLDDIEHRRWSLDGEFSEVLGKFVRDHRIDLLVLGTRGRTGISKLLLGSIAQEIFHHVACPVLTIGPWSREASRQPQVRKVLFATDLSPASEAAIPYVLMAAKTWQSKIDVLHICSSGNCHCQKKDDLKSRIDLRGGKATPLSVEYHLLPRRPFPAVLDFARENAEDAIILGLDPHRSLYAGPAVSHAYEIVRCAECPVLSVRSA